MIIHRTRTIELIAAALILLWVYTSVSKLLIYTAFKHQLIKQPLPEALAPILAVFLPAIELLAAVLLCFNGLRKAGLWLSAMLMTAFTVYVGLVRFGYFPKVPCSCGGVLKSLGWEAHFYFNIFWLLLTAVGIFFYYRPKKDTG